MAEIEGKISQDLLMWFYRTMLRIPIFSGAQSLEGSKPVLLMLGETPRTTLTSAHLRREGWRSHRDPFEGTKPVVRMMFQ